MSDKNDIVGKKFGRLLVEGLSHSVKYEYENGTKIFYHHIYDCLCDCGKQTKVRRSNLLNGNTRSCGCLNSEIVKLRSTKHGQYSKFIMIEIGNDVKTIEEWANYAKIPVKLLIQRVKKGWDKNKLLSPVRHYKKNYNEFIYKKLKDK